MVRILLQVEVRRRRHYKMNAFIGNVLHRPRVAHRNTMPCRDFSNSPLDRSDGCSVLREPWDGLLGKWLQPNAGYVPPGVDLEPVKVIKLRHRTRLRTEPNHSCCMLSSYLILYLGQTDD